MKGATVHLPTAKEINPYNDLDGQWAEKNFLGKTQAEAEALFREGFDNYQEDLMWMGPVAFRFYVEPAIRYLLSDDATGNYCVPLFFSSVIRFRLDHEPHELVPVAARLAEACGHIHDHWHRFGMSPEEDGRDTYKELQTALLNLGGTTLS